MAAWWRSEEEVAGEEIGGVCTCAVLGWVRVGGAASSGGVASY